jgi:glycosyltransferase involved in cell wall biosynthesis
MMRVPSVSICIPTYRRPAHLRAALHSCLDQAAGDVEVIVSDDSPDEASARVVQEFARAHDWPVRYRRNTPPLGQNRNVNALFEMARGELLMLLHDDDLILPGGLRRLLGCWQQHPRLDGAFGKQQLIHDDGTEFGAAESAQLNRDYHRTAENRGLLAHPVKAGFTRMFPNDGFVVRTALARAVGYRDRDEVGDACDTDFGIRLCAAARTLCFVDEYTMKYRLSAVSVSKTSIVQPVVYDLLTRLPVPDELRPELDAARKALIGGAISGFARLRKPGRAWSLFWSDDYPMRARLSPRGLRHLGIVGFSALQATLSRPPAAPR